MKSSFKKIEKSTASQKSPFGHPDLDAVFSNSLSKGHLMVIEEDHPTTYYLSLLRYFISSNYHKAIPSVVFDSLPNRWRHFISPILKKSPVKQETSKSEIAWRYDRQNIRLNQLAISEGIDYLDLSRNLENLRQDLLKVEGYPHHSLKEFYRQIEGNFISIQEDEKDIKPKKILLSTMPSYFYNDSEFTGFLQALRCLTRSSHVFTLITVPPIISDKIRNKLLTYSDYYLRLGKLGEGYQDFSASLTILKEVSTCQIRTNYRGESIWGIKSKKKQILVEALYEQAVFNDLDEKKTGAKPLCSSEKQESVDF